MDSFGRNKSYQSASGYRMWGGQTLPQPQPARFRWLSLGLVVGVAIVLGTYFAIFHS